MFLIPAALLMTQSSYSSLVKSTSKSFVRSHPKIMLLARRRVWKCATVLLPEKTTKVYKISKMS